MRGELGKLGEVRVCCIYHPAFIKDDKRTIIYAVFIHRDNSHFYIKILEL